MAECVEGPACPVVQPTHMVYPVSLHSNHGHKAMHADMLEGHRAVNYAAGADWSPGCVSQASDSGQVNSSLPLICKRQQYTQVSKIITTKSTKIDGKSSNSK